MLFTLPEQSDWCDNMPIRSYDYTPVLPVNVSRPYFSTRLQGAHGKFELHTRSVPVSEPHTCNFNVKELHTIAYLLVSLTLVIPM